MNFLSLAIPVQGGLLAIALLAGMFMRRPPWLACTINLEGFGWGILATMPMLIFFVLAYRSELRSFIEIRRLTQELLGKQLADCHYLDLVVIGMMAGISEEFFFRGVLEPTFSGYGTVVGLLVCNVIFGICHAVTPAYAILVAVLGCYLSLTLRFTSESNLLIPIISHSLYDVIAFIVVRNSYLKTHSILVADDVSSTTD